MTRREIATILGLAALGCAPATNESPARVVVDEAPREPEPSEEPSEPPPSGLLATEGRGIIGTLVVNEPRSITHPSEYCLDDGRRLLGAPARIDDLNIFTKAPVAALAGKTVIARGAEEPSLLSALSEAGTCSGKEDAREMPQMRSDWVSAEGGFRTTRSKLAALPFLRAHHLQEVDFGEMLRVEGERVIVELRNPLASSLDGITARAHYEGGPGKPMPRFEPIRVKVPPGGQQRLALAGYVEAGPAGRDEGEPRGIYRLASVDLDGEIGALTLRVRLPVDLPKRR